MADGQQVDKLREEALKERLTGIDKSVREVSRGVQVIRDKQVTSNRLSLQCKANSHSRVTSLDTCSIVTPHEGAFVARSMTSLHPSHSLPPSALGTELQRIAGNAFVT